MSRLLPNSFQKKSIEKDQRTVKTVYVEHIDDLGAWAPLWRKYRVQKAEIKNLKEQGRDVARGLDGLEFSATLD